MLAILNTDTKLGRDEKGRGDGWLLGSVEVGDEEGGGDDDYRVQG
jgi:hypothetical protein